MKLQGVAIIFIMIAFPMILVLSYYLGLQIDTIKLQTDYDNKLIDATYDSLLAFEINTANEDLSAAADSLRSIVNASATTFTNTLGTSLGLSNASKEKIREYVPAMLFTMYDGYYIYAPTEVPVIMEDLATDDEIRDVYGISDPDGIEISEGAQYDTDGSVIFEANSGGVTTTDSTAARKEQDYVLKSYMPYSATYIDGPNRRATINYTLDNYMSISAQIGNVYYTKSGYYIKDDLLDDCPTISGWDTMGQDQIKGYCESGDNISIVVDGQTISYAETNDLAGNKITSIEKYEQVLARLSDNDPTNTDYDMDSYRDLKANLDNLKAITYYLTNTAFSKWVNANLGWVKGDNLQHTYDISETTESNTNVYYDFSSDGQIFTSGNPELAESEFNNHKYNIIKNAIQYNLNLAMSAYNRKYVSSQEFRVPMLTDSEWEQITSKVSIVSFMQGLPCGTKTYTGYSVVSSTNNELTVIPEEIYYVNADQFNDENSTEYYHRIDCPLLVIDPTIGTIAFKSKEVKYDKIYDKHTNLYNYDHKNLACYNCIVQNNYENDSSDVNGDGNKYISFQDFILNTTDVNKKRAYYIAVGKERQNLYKTTGYSKNEGISITGVGSSINWPANCEKAEVTISVTTPAGIVGEIKVGGNGTGKMISTSTRSTQTVEIENNGNNGNIIVDSVGITVQSIRYIYK